jgi:hypothetical protein
MGERDLIVQTIHHGWPGVKIKLEKDLTSGGHVVYFWYTFGVHLIGSKNYEREGKSDEVEIDG